MQLKYVITGGPGTGKTTLIQELEKRNYKCTPEISRQVTVMARKKGIDYLFLKDPLLFSKLLLEGREKQYLEAVNSDAPIVFFDRGIPDVHAYLNHFKTAYPDVYLKKSSLYRYDGIFILPPWKDIYKNDQERFETYQSSVSIYNHLKEAYSMLDYDIIEVPYGKVQERTDFILDYLNFL
ncbi:MAG: AAA family ATPase [Aureibaculum sp.]